MEHWPTLFIIGAPKAGTTSLYEYLKNIPGIYMSPVKEPHFFSPNYPPRETLNIIKNEQDYLNLFCNVKNETVIGEASTNYLWDPATPGLIFSKVPDAKIIVILRDPVERAYSHYLMDIHDQVVKQPFHEIIDKIIQEKVPPIISEILNGSFYFEQIKRYYDIFSKNNVKIVIFEEFTRNVLPTLQEILHFLNVNYTVKELDVKIHNPFFLPKGSLENLILKSKFLHKITMHLVSENIKKKFRETFLITRKKPTLLENDRVFLTKYFYEDVEKLQKFLGQRLPWKNFQTL